MGIEKKVNAEQNAVQGFEKLIEEARRQAKQMVEVANRAKEVFIANMSHDMRTPIAGIIGMANRLKAEGDTAKDREYGEVICAAGERFLGLLDDILRVTATGESDEEVLTMETFSLQERIKQLQALVQPHLKTTAVALNISIDPTIPDYIVSDRIKIDRILFNVLGNALKFTHQGRIDMVVEQIAQKNEPLCIKIRVSDTGIGISDTHVSRIFDRFYRVNPSFKNRYVGNGVGLYFVQQDLLKLEGSITVHSELGKGSTFTVMMPVKEGKREDAPMVTTSPPFPAFSIRPQPAAIPMSTVSRVYPIVTTQKQLKVLLVEDDDLARRIEKSFLESAGLLVEEAENAEIGFQYLMTHAYDLIVTDIGLPGMSGNQFASLARHWENLTKRSPIPIIGLTAHGAEQWDSDSAPWLDRMLAKPITEEKIADFMADFFVREKQYA